MTCRHCGGLVYWRGPWLNLTHTECRNCGARNCQVVEPEDEPEEQEAETQEETNP